MTIKYFNVVVFLLALLGCGVLSSEEKRAIVPRDCVTVRNLKPADSTPSWRWPIKLNEDGRSVAFMVESPNLETNTNDADLYIRAATSQDASSPSQLLLRGEISDFLWSSHGHSLMVLIKQNGARILESIDVDTRKVQLVARASVDIDEFSVDQNGDVVVYTTRESDSQLTPPHSAEEIARGYRIPFESSDEQNWIHSSVFVIRRENGSWTAPIGIVFHSPLGGQKMMALARASNGPLMPTLSPDGEKLLVAYWDFSTTLPAEWQDSATMKLVRATGQIRQPRLLLMYSIKTGESTAPLKTQFVDGLSLWSADSKSFFVEAGPEIGSAVEAEEARNGTLTHSHGAVLYFVNTATGEKQVVAPRVAEPVEAPIYLGAGGVLLARTASASALTRFVYREGKWKEDATIPLPVTTVDAIAADETYVFGARSDLTTPPELFAYRIADKQVSVFEKLNPQFDNLLLAQPTEVEWTTPEGMNLNGILLLPPGYNKAERYPLVIHTKPFAQSFICSFGHFPSFAPQPIADAGIMYLAPGSLGHKAATTPEQNLADYLPKGYPGKLSEVAFNMEAWDGAVKTLSEKGLVDPKRVGIIGFSRTGWYTEFILAHSKTHYRAATVTDNVQYSLGEYWFARDAGTMKEFESTYGGPPYGKTLKNWLDYSVSFNLDKIHTPILMEEMGYGFPLSSNPHLIPDTLVTPSEVFSGLNRLGKPVELYFYPNEDHTPDDPQARLATMQRNLDWYRFWLQDYERPNPEDPLQYTRWEKMRESQKEIDKEYDSISGVMEPHQTSSQNEQP